MLPEVLALLSACRAVAAVLSLWTGRFLFNPCRRSHGTLFPFPAQSYGDILDDSKAVEALSASKSLAQDIEEKQVRVPSLLR
jgi:hypothetical protein